MNPTVSIVIPCYKGERFLEEAINSCLTQTFMDLEVVVVDDCSPDGCFALASRLASVDVRVRVMRRDENGGVARAFNTGFHNARGHYFMRLAQDDRLKPTAVASLVQALNHNPRAGLAYADVEIINEYGHTCATVRKLPSPCDALMWGNGVGVCVMWRREVWESIGEFDPLLDAAEDFDYWVRIADKFDLCKASGVLMEFRRHPSMGSNVFSSRQEAASLTIRTRQLAGTKKFSCSYWCLRRSLSHHYYSFSSDHSLRGKQWAALKRLLKSISMWPLPYPRDRAGSSFARMKRFGVILGRMAGIMPVPAVADGTEASPL